MEPAQRRVVISGMGAITPLGRNVQESWEGVVGGRTVVDRITNFDVEGARTQIASQISYDYIPLLEEYFDRRTVQRTLKRSARFAHFALIAAAEALQDAGLLNEEKMILPQFRDNTAIFIGTGGGAIDEIAECANALGEKRRWAPEELAQTLSQFLRSAHFSERDEFEKIILPKFEGYAKELLQRGKSLTKEELADFVRHLERNYRTAVLRVLSDSGAFRSSITFGARGGGTCGINACATGNANIGLAFEYIKGRHAEIVVAGGSDACINPVGHWTFSLVEATSKRNHDPKHASRPFDRERDGFVMAEGGATLALEELSHALKRGAKIYGEVLGWAMTNDAKGDVEPEEETQALAMAKAIRLSGIGAGEVDYVNAHGTSTPIGDQSETRAIKRVFESNTKIPVSSVKSSVGHLLGAAGSFEAICCVKSLETGILPPTINYEFPDPECDLDYIPNVARRQKIRTVMNNSFGFGGQNAVLVIREYCYIP